MSARFDQNTVFARGRYDKSVDMWSMGISYPNPNPNPPNTATLNLHPNPNPCICFPPAKV